MKRLFIVLLLAVGLVISGSTVLWWAFARRPPGAWRESDSIEKIRIGWAKEQEWADQPFTPIEDSEAFLEKLRGIRMRVDAPVPPDAVEGLRRILFDQLVCRHSGSIDCYNERFARTRRNPLDEDSRDWSAALYRVEMGRELPDAWERRPVFEELWQAEYRREGHHRFEAVALGPQGSIIAISTLSGSAQADIVPPRFLFTQDELERWWSWQGAPKRRSAELHPGPRSLRSIIEERGECIYASVILIVRSANGEVWCWSPHWYLDPVDNRWQLHGAVIVTHRPGYVVPM